MYIDEVGNASLKASENPNSRYLSLCGVAFELSYVAETVFPSIASLKASYFASHPDEPVILHRKELVNKRYPFESLRNREVQESFDQDLLHLLRKLNYTVVTVVIDKLEHLRKYTAWSFDPYHYCLRVLVERYVLWLREIGGVGDVMAESRGGKEDRRLKDSFHRLYRTGTEFLEPKSFSAYLTSSQLKMKLKSNNIAGLQVADLLAHPSYKSTLARFLNEPLARNFGGQIAAILEESKYYRSPDGRIEGYGRKLLP